MGAGWHVNRAGVSPSIGIYIKFTFVLTVQVFNQLSFGGWISKIKKLFKTYGSLHV